jgi:hypothetical protein
MTGGGGRHFGLSRAGFGTSAGGEGAPKAPFPCNAAIRSRRLPALEMLSRASETDKPLEDFPLRSSDDPASPTGCCGEGGRGFHATGPGLGRGCDGTGGVCGGVVALVVSKAAILSRRDPGFGFGLSESDIRTRQYFPTVTRLCGTRVR